MTQKNKNANLYGVKYKTEKMDFHTLNFKVQIKGFESLLPHNAQIICIKMEFRPESN